MKKKIEDKIMDKIMDIEQQMEKMQNIHLYYLTPQWEYRRENVRVLNELLNEVKAIK